MNGTTVALKRFGFRTPLISKFISVTSRIDFGLRTIFHRYPLNIKHRATCEAARPIECESFLF